ncbi:MAG: hypothetical protein IBJ03_15605 [Gemmatimonadaceae bacterium]|nr:hypothetical protein [Gemmatimonadaceae bacterium]
MRNTLPTLSVLLSICTQPVTAAAQLGTSGKIPDQLLGAFTDDYRIKYQITDTLFVQGSRLKYRVLSWNPAEQYLIAQNDQSNPADGGLFTRIDWVLLTDMAPWTWAYCLTAYRAPTADSARATPPAKRDTPRTGCNGFPFSRMQRVE